MRLPVLLLPCALLALLPGCIRSSDQKNSKMSNFELKMTVQGREGEAPLELNFSAQPSGGSGTLSYRWDFDDGETSREQNPKHTFYKPGQYGVKVTVTDSLGRSLTGQTRLEVKGNPAAQSARIVVLQRPDGSATLTSTGSKIYGKLERSTWKLLGQEYPQDVLKISPMTAGTYEAGLTLSSGGKNYPSSVIFKVDRFGGNRSFEEEVLRLTNDARARGFRCGKLGYGGPKLAPLGRNILLDLTATVHATAMAANNFFAHRSSVDGSEVDARADALGYRFQSVGENIAAGQRSPLEVVDGWLRSEGHCRNIMGDFTEIGLAYVVSPRADNKTQWVQVFGKPLGG